MATLQGSSVSKILESIPINNKTRKQIDNFILDYLESNPNLIDNFIYKHGLYHVFLREIDERKNRLIYLSQSFSTEEKAIDWVITNGRAQIDDYSRYHRGNFAFSIVWRRNKWNYFDGYGSFPSVDYPIYLTFAFDKPTYDKLIYIHRKSFEWTSEDLIIPYWINYVDSNNNIKIGYDLKDFQNILDDVLKQYDSEEYFEEHNEFEQDVSKMYTEFSRNPRTYSNKMKKIIFKRYYTD